MDCPGFQVLAYGIYDSRIAFPKLTYSPARQLNRFELELITDNLGGTSYINDTPYPLKKGLFLCGKPGQTRYSHMPTYCHYVHIRTEDPALQQMLMELPDACRLSNPTPIQQVFQELASLPEADSLQEGSLVLKLISLLRFRPALKHRKSR